MERDEMKQRMLDEITASKRRYAAIVSVLDSIKTVAKKSGGVYESMPKNFTSEGEATTKYNVEIEWEKSIWDTRRYDAMKIVFSEREGVRDTLYFHVYECLDEWDKKHAEMKASGRLVEGGIGLKDFYELTPTEILEEIKTERERATERLKLLEDNEGELVAKGLEIYDHITAIKTLQNELTESSGKWNSTGYQPIRRALEDEFGRLRY